MSSWESCAKLVKAIAETSGFLRTKGFDGVLVSSDVFFITSQELLDMYPGKTDKEREYLKLLANENKT